MESNGGIKPKPDLEALERLLKDKGAWVNCPICDGPDWRTADTYALVTPAGDAPPYEAYSMICENCAFVRLISVAQLHGVA